MRIDLLRSFAHLMAMGDGLGLRSLLTDDAEVFDPTLGRIAGTDLAEFAAQWRDRTGGREARWISATCSERVCVAEWEFAVEGHAGIAPLPVAAVVECSATDRFVSVRLYHTFWPLTGAHRVVEPACTHTDSAGVPDDAIGRYLAALSAGDAEAIASIFAEDAVVREPAGGEATHAGPAAIRSYYQSLFPAGGGLDYSICNVVDDGSQCALEYIIEGWGDSSVAAQGGVAVYERAGSDKLAAARIYDDVVPGS